MSDEGDAIFKRLEEDRGASIEVLTPEVRDQRKSHVHVMAETSSLSTPRHTCSA